MPGFRPNLQKVYLSSLVWNQNENTQLDLFKQVLSVGLVVLNNCLLTHSPFRNTYDSRSSQFQRQVMSSHCDCRHIHVIRRIVNTNFYCFLWHKFEAKILTFLTRLMRFVDDISLRNHLFWATLYAHASSLGDFVAGEPFWQTAARLRH